LRNKGFTLIELMVVVAIMGILAAIAVGLFRQYVGKAQQSEAKELLSGIYTAELAYYSSTNKYALPSEAGFVPSIAPKYYTNIGDTHFVFTSISFTATCSVNIDNDATIDSWEVTNVSRQPVNISNDVQR